MADGGGWLERHPTAAHVWKALLVAAVLAIAGWIAHKLLPKSVQDAAWAWLGGGQSWPHWLLLVLTLSTLAWPLYWVWRASRRDRPPPYEAYRTDEFLGLRWRWNWDGPYTVGLRAFCTHCDLQLDARAPQSGVMAIYSGELYYHCSDCGKTDFKVRVRDEPEFQRRASLSAEREARRRGLLE